MPLTIEQMSAHGFSERIIDLWRDAGVGELLPLQEDAIMRTGVLQNQSLIVFAPTSSGKTLIAEFAAVRHLEQNHRVIYLVPTKALAEEKYRRFTSLYRPLGYRVLAATRERPDSDAPALQGRFDLLIAVYEKLKSYLVQRPTLLSQVGLVVADEVQMLGEAERGGVVDILLTKVAQSPYEVQFLGLSAVLGDAMRIARWLGCDLLKQSLRPIELREGVFNIEDGHFHYRTFNSGEEGAEDLAPGAKFTSGGLAFDDENFYAEAVFALARYLAQERDEQVLIFVPTRRMSRWWAEKLATNLNLPSAEAAISELEKYEETHSRAALLSCFRKGVAFHNADLSWGLRKLIEQHYNAGNLRLLVSTSTLGEGVNLTGRNVIQVPEMIAQDAWTGRHNFVPLSRQRFRNQGGRAGRLGHEKQFGRSILIAAGSEQVERLMREYVYGELEPVQPPLLRSDIAPIILDLVASGISRSRSDIASFLIKTYTGLVQWGAREDEFQKRIDDEIARCVDLHFLTRTPAGELSTTGIGAVTAATGIRLGTASLFTRWLSELRGHIPEAFEALIVAAFTPDAADFALPVTRREKRLINFPEIVSEHITKERIESMPLLAELLERPGGFADADFSALKKALILNEWISSADTLSIEEHFGTLAGIIVKLAEHFQWLLLSCAALADALASKKEMAHSVSRLAERLRVGLGDEGIGLARLHIEGLSRSHLQALVREGFDSPEALIDADPERLFAILPRAVAQALMDELQGLKTPRKEKPQVRPEPEAPEESVSAPAEPESSKEKAPLLVFRLSEPGIITYAGKRLRLTPLPYNLLLTLARRAGNLVSYVTIDQEVWPEQKVERQQVSFHRAALIRALARAIGKERARKLIKTYAGQGLLLNLAPDDVHIQ